MKYTLKKLSETKVEFSVSLDAKDLKKGRELALQKMAPDVKVKGFRAGKAPLSEIEKNANPAVLDSESLNFAINSAIPVMFKESETKALVLPSITVTKYVPLEVCEFKAVSEVYPEAKLGDYKKLKVKKTEAIKVAPKDIEGALKRIASSFAEAKAVKREAKLGDEVVIDFVGKRDGVAFDGGTAKDFKLELGSGSFIPGFEEGIVGKESGNKFDLDLTFPKDYGVADLAGAKVVFEVLLKQVNEITLPEIDDEFAMKVGPFKTLKELEKDIEGNLKEQAEKQMLDVRKDELIKALVAVSKVEAPEILVEDNIKMLRQDVEHNARGMGVDFAGYLKLAKKTEEEWEKEAREVAVSRVKAGLLLQEMAKVEKLEADDKIVDVKIAEMKEVYKKDPEAVKQLDGPKVRFDIKNRLTIEKVIDRLVELNK